MYITLHCFPRRLSEIYNRERVHIRFSIIFAKDNINFEYENNILYYYYSISKFTRALIIVAVKISHSVLDLSVTLTSHTIFASIYSDKYHKETCLEKKN